MEENRYEITELFEKLTGTDNNAACHALQILQDLSLKTDAVYPYMDQLNDMLDNANSYIRTRRLTLIAYNTKWDKDYNIQKALAEIKNC